MARRTIEIEDVLPDCVENAIDEVGRELREYIDCNSPDETPCLHNDLDYDGSIHQIIDGAVPIWTNQIEAAWFLHGSDLERAHEDAGIGDNPRENSGMTAIYCYIERKVCEWYAKNAERIFDELTAQDE